MEKEVFCMKKSVKTKMKLLGKVKKITAMSLAAVMTAGILLGAPSVDTAAAETAVKTSSAATKIYTNQDSLKNYEKITGINEDTVLGLDFSEYQQALGWGKTFKDYKAETVDNIFSYIKEQGVNTISVKAAVKPGDSAKEYLSLDTNIKTLQAAQKAGLDTNLVLLYSDDITYANTQTLPDGWTTENAKEKAIAYTEEVLTSLKDAGVTPTMITIGNEVNWNFLTLSSSWDGFLVMEQISKLVQEAGIKAAFSVSAPKSGDGIKWIMQQLSYAAKDNSVNASKAYDYLGVNIYPSADDDMNTYMETARDTFNSESSKPENAQFIISGVKCAWESDEDDNVTVESQAKDIYNLMSSVIDENNAGGIICNNAAVTGDYYSFFEEDGSAQYSLAIFAYAQGDQVDTTTYRDPYQYGGETGLKEQKVNISKISSLSSSAIRGVDVSSCIALQNAGVKFYDNEGKESTLFKVLSDNGVNYVRIRIWNDPKNSEGETYGGGGNDLETDLKIAKEAAKYGMKILICFQYSDFWADPAQQMVPKAWKDDINDSEKMSQHIYDYTKEVIGEFQKTGAQIGMVQIGNEITQGILWSALGITGQVSSYKEIWTNKNRAKTMNQFLSAGSKAVREAAPDALVALQLETPEVAKYKYIMDCWEDYGVDYDVLGSSYYPFWYANTLSNLKEIQEYAHTKGKLFAVLETSWFNTLQDADGTNNQVGEDGNNTSAYEVGPQGQADMLEDLYSAIMSQDNGLGAFYWEPAWLPVKPGWKNWKYNKEMSDKYGTGWAAQGAKDYAPAYKMYYNGEPTWGGTAWDNMSLFDFNGYPLDSLRFYKDAVSKGEEQIYTIKYVDASGNTVAPNRYVKVTVGEKKTYTVPAPSGYEVKSAKTITLTGSKEGIKGEVDVTCKKLPVKQNIILKKKTYNISYGTTYKFGKQVTAKGKLTYKSSNKNIATINSTTGKITAKKPGKVVITIKAAATADYKKATKKVTIYIVPKKSKITKVSSSKKRIRVSVKKDSKASGYQIKISTSKKFKKGVKKTSTNNAKKTTLSITKLKSGKTYYVKARSYKKIGKKKYYSTWSKVKKIKVK